MAFGAHVTSTGLFAFSSSAVDLQNAGNSLFNQGTITSVAGPAATTSGTDQTIGNSGLIEGGIAGVGMQATRSMIDNAGSIRNLAGDFQYGGVWFAYSDGRLDNSGVIAAAGIDSAGVQVLVNQGTGPLGYSTIPEPSFRRGAGGSSPQS